MREGDFPMVTREYWLEKMLKTASPVLEALAAGRLCQELPMKFHPDRAEYAHLEAFGRTVTGMAPWLSAPLEGPERETRDKYLDLIHRCMDMATEPESPDRMNFTRGYGQALVDAAFLAHGIVRAPKELYFDLPARVRANVAGALGSTRRFTPFRSNWLLFSAMIEAALRLMGEDYDLAPVDDALDSFERWYVGDGLYGDGAHFHADYYNSFVIHPMLLDILEIFGDDPRRAGFLENERRRAVRFAGTLERLIAPDGTYPMVGRSVTYRCGAFHALSAAALKGLLPERLPKGQVRSALTAVIERTLGDGSFDEKGFLLPGVYGCQPGLAEDYICVGSLYLCEAVFLPLGLPPEDPFWTEPDMPWTQKRLADGDDLPADHAED